MDFSIKRREEKEKTSRRPYEAAEITVIRLVVAYRVKSEMVVEAAGGDARGSSVMKHKLACIIAIAGWYLLYPPVPQKGGPDSYPALSGWHIDGSYGSAVDCREAYQSDLNALQGLRPDSSDFLQVQAGRCVATNDPRFAEQAQAALLANK